MIKMANLKMNCGETIALLSSAAFRRSPAGLKYPSSSILRFQTQNSYNGVTAAFRSKYNNENKNILKIKEEGNGEVSMMLDNVKFIGQREDVEAAVVRAIRNDARRKIISFAQITLVCILVFIYILKSNFGRIITYLKSSWASGLTTWNHPLYVVTFAVIISKPISEKINDRLKVFILQEMMVKVNFIRNQEIKEFLKGLLQEIKVNPERINDPEIRNFVTTVYNIIKSNDTATIDTTHLKKSLIALHQEIKVNPGCIDVTDRQVMKDLTERIEANNIEGKVITPLIEEEETEESSTVEKYGGNENGQHMRED